MATAPSPSRQSRRTGGASAATSGRHTGPSVAPDPQRAAADLRVLQDHARAIVDCTACALHTGRTTPIVGEGPLDARLAIVGLAPRAHEDLQGRALAGGARNVLDHALRSVGVDPASVRLTSVIRCRPADDRTPSDAELRACAQHLRRELELVDPEVVVALGASTASVLLGAPLSLERVAGYRLDALDGRTVIPTYHPADVVRGVPQAAPSLTRHLAVAKAVLDGRLATGAQVRAEARTGVRTPARLV